MALLVNTLAFMIECFFFTLGFDKTNISQQDHLLPHLYVNREKLSKALRIGYLLFSYYKTQTSSLGWQMFNRNIGTAATVGRYYTLATY